jgi:hypothetical protein
MAGFMVGSSLFDCVCSGPLRAGRVKTTENRLNLDDFTKSSNAS